MTTVIVPMNRLDRVKGRLDPLLTGTERRALMLATLATVLEAVRGAGETPLVLTADPEEFVEAGIEASYLAEDGLGGGLNGQLERVTAGLEAALILHADLPLATSGAIARVLDAGTGPRGIAIVESADGGTNAMLLRPAGAFALAYGKGSHAAHVAAAGAAGYRVVRVEAPELALDLDTEDDLRAFMAAPGWEETRAGAVLREAGIPARVGRATGEGRRRR